MAALWCGLVLVLISSALHRRSEAIFQADVNRALLAYNRDFDTCKDVTDSTHSASKRAADEACDQAFKALDSVNLNTCYGWRNAGCRLVSGQKTRQCTCLITDCDDYGIRSQILKSFRECAIDIRTEERRWRVRAAPSIDFQLRRSKYDYALHEAENRRASSYSDFHGGAGTSSDQYTFGAAGAGTSSEQYTFGGPGSAFRAYSSGGAGSSEGVGTASSEGFPSASGNPPLQWRRAGRKAFPCHICPKSYSELRNLRTHMRSHDTDETKCPVCHRTFAMKGNLISHMKSTHPGAQLPKKGVRGRPVVTDAGPFVCDQCGRRYSVLNTLRDHVRSHETLDTHCFPCKITLSSRSNYLSHLRRFHPKEAIAEDAAENERYLEMNPEECGICKKRFKNVRGLQEHRLTHEGKTQCDICGLVLSRRSALYNHKRKEHPK